MEFKIDQTKPIQAQVYETIKESIIKLRFKPGQRLSEKELSEKLQVSRTPIREAFIRLSETGLLEVYPQRGTFVSYINLRDVYEALFIREALEVASIAKTLEKATDGDVSLLQGIIKEQKVCQMKDDPEGFYKLDEQFHRSLILMSGYSKVWETIQAVKLHLDRVRYLSLKSAHIKISLLIEQHEQILEAIRDKNVKQAKHCLGLHITKFTQETIDFFEQNYKDYFAEH